MPWQTAQTILWYCQAKTIQYVLASSMCVVFVSWKKAHPQMGLASFKTTKTTARNGEHTVALQGYRNPKLRGCKYGASVLWGNQDGPRTVIPFHASCTGCGWDHSDQRQEGHLFSLGGAPRGIAKSGQSCGSIHSWSAAATSHCIRTWYSSTPRRNIGCSQ